MSDNEDYKTIPSTSAVSRLGITAIGYIACGVLLFLLQVLSRVRGLGYVVGTAICLAGIATLLSKEPADRKNGILICAIGVLTFLSRIPVIAPFAATLLSIAAVGFIVMGIINGIKFLFALRDRA